MFRYLSIIVLSFLFIPLLAFAGLVPCGGSGMGEGAPAGQCDLCHFIVLVNNVQTFLLFNLLMPAGTVALIIAGIMLLTAGGNPGQIEKGRAVFKNVLLGMVIAFAAYLVIDAILGNLLQTGYMPWNSFPSCKLFT